MIRKLSLAVAVATALSPMGALALGLGEIHPQSALNQIFKADIDLLSVTREELQDVRVSLASQEAFEKAGMQRPFHLTGLKFAPQMTASGKPVITISSKDPIREPFLNFLVEVNWPKGRLVREFTVLLDPPVTLQRKPARVNAPSAGRQPTSRVMPSRSAAAPREASPVAMVGAAGEREYGPVQPNDNLWSIAKQMQQGGESIEQVMMALQDYNPSAFVNDNVNNLKVGSVLRLPEDANVTARSKQEAREEFMAQTRAWRSGTAAPAPSTERGGARAAEPPQDRLKLASPKPAGGEQAEREGAASDEIQRLQNEILLVRESNEGALQENDALRTRVQELENQIKDIQRLLTLKNDQLAEVQAAQSVAAEKMDEMQQPPETAEAPVTEEVVTEEAVVEEPGVTVAETPMAAPETAQPPAEQTAQPEPETPEAQPPAEAAGVTPEPAPAVTETQVPSEPAESPAVEPKPEVQPPKLEKPPVGTTPVKKVGYFDSLKENSTMVAAVGGIAVVVIGLLTLVMRRRKEAEAEFAESILVSPDSDILSRGTDDNSSLTSPTDETSFMSDFSPSDIDALQDETGEVDPLSEADVYIAYGRYQQAEELIKQAIEKYPDRVELKQKLLEIYYSAKKPDVFTDLAQEMSNAGLQDRNPDAWSKIAAMGKELNPSHALFAGAAGMAAAEGLDEIGDLDLDLDAPDITRVPEPAPTPAPPAEEPQDALGDLGGDFDSMDLSELDNLDEMDSESLETDLSLDSEFLNKMEGVDDSQTSEDSDALDIDLSDLEVDSIPASSAEAAPQVEEEPLPFDLSEIEDVLDKTQTDDQGAIELEDSESLDNLDLESIEKELEGLSSSLESDEATGDVDEISLLHSHSENLDLDSTDEITTKLDLARAYIDMGDNEGAKSILEEVMGEGSDAQQQEAKELLETLGS